MGNGDAAMQRGVRPRAGDGNASRLYFTNQLRCCAKSKNAGAGSERAVALFRSRAAVYCPRSRYLCRVTPMPRWWTAGIYHLCQKCVGAIWAEYGVIDETVLDSVWCHGDWLVTHHYGLQKPVPSLPCDVERLRQDAVSAIGVMKFTSPSTGGSTLLVEYSSATPRRRSCDVIPMFNPSGWYTLPQIAFAGRGELHQLHRRFAGQRLKAAYMG
jgi:hypothetical protein